MIYIMSQQTRVVITDQTSVVFLDFSFPSFLLKKLKDISPLVGPLMALFWISDGIFPGF